MSSNEEGNMSDYDQLEFRHLKYILAVAETRSFSAGAVLAHTTQSNISTQIAHLEGILDIEIFTRGREGVVPTPYGEVLVACAKDLLQVRQDVLDMLRALRTGEITPLRLGYSSLVGKGTLHSVIETTHGLFPHCEILSEGDEIESLEQRVSADELDGALVTLPIEHQSALMTCIVAREKLCVCMRSDDPLAEHEAIPAHLLNNRVSIFQFPLVHRPAYRKMLELLSAVGITPKENKPTTNVEHIQWMVQQGKCLAFFRSGTRLMPGLILKPIHGADWTLDTALVLKPSSQHPALALLLRELRKRARDIGSLWAPTKPDSVRSTQQRKGPKSVRGKGNGALPLFEAS
jgi:DNA-binding transcriptional LysR family regulator